MPWNQAIGVCVERQAVGRGILQSSRSGPCQSREIAAMTVIGSSRANVRKVLPGRSGWQYGRAIRLEFGL